MHLCRLPWANLTNLIKKLKILYIVVGNKNGFLATASFLLELAKRATTFTL